MVLQALNALLLRQQGLLVFYALLQHDVLLAQAGELLLQRGQALLALIQGLCALGVLL